MKQLAEVRFTCGRAVLFVADIAVAMQGDKCRHSLPEHVAEPIPESELEIATIGDKRACDLPMEVVRFFRGDRWTVDGLKWAAERINTAAKPETPAD